MRVQKVLSLVSLIIVMQWCLTSCSGGFVSQNGLFENGHRELRDSLLATWRVVKSERGLLSDDVYEFYKDPQGVGLKVNGVMRRIAGLNSFDGFTFSFEYQDDAGQKVFVTGQFKSNAKKELILIEEAQGAKLQTLQSSFILKKGTGKSGIVVANLDKR